MENINKFLEESKKKSKKRNFVQSVDLSINLKNIDFKKPENRFTEEVVLPKGRGKNVKIVVIGKDLIIKSKGKADELINEDKLGKLEKNRKEIKKLANSYDFFIAEASFMLRIGKSLGKVLGPRGKMPKPLPPQADPTPIINKLKNTVRISLKESPVIHCVIGTENMKDEDLIENMNAVMSTLENKLPKGKHNIGSVYLKTTMGPAIKIK